MKEPASSPAPSAEEEVTRLGPVAAPQWGAVGQISGALAPVRCRPSPLALAGGRGELFHPPQPRPCLASGALRGRQQIAVPGALPWLWPGSDLALGVRAGSKAGLGVIFMGLAHAGEGNCSSSFCSGS